MVRIVTDSNTMIPWSLVDRLGIVVVPLAVTIGGIELIEDRRLDIVDAYRRLRAGQTATTSAPSPGAFADVYRRLDGEPIVSVHIGSNVSGTANVARLGAQLAEIVVEVVDTGAASFLAGCCVLAAAEAARDGGDVAAVVDAAVRTSAEVETVFTLAEIDRAREGGRFDGRSLDADSAGDGDGVPVLRMRGGAFERITSVVSDAQAARAMFDAVVATPGRLRIGVGDADAGPVVDQLFERLRAARPDDDLIRYVVGPSVAAHAGMGTFGIVHHPLAH